MTENDLEKIIAIFEEGSMAKAAQKLFITQPALSKSLAKVEKELGEVLFIRSNNGLIPTYAGKYFVEKAYQIMKLYEDVRVEFCELNHMRKGTLKLGSAERIGALLLPELLKKFSARYPNIQIDIVEENSHTLEEKLLMGAIDLAIICLPLRNANISYKVFYRGPIYLGIPKDSPLNDRSYTKTGEKMKYMDLQDVLQEKFILTKPIKKTRMAADRILKKAGQKYTVSIESRNIETTMRLVAGGMGISLIPDIYTRCYDTGNEISYYRLEEKYDPYWKWAVIYNGDIEHLTRPSRELYNIICQEGCKFPTYLCT
ncbi:LysR family transcriptional regulator [Acidaminococcus massiliensis]|uniref:LysR family transcriptional regulator n=1 Tax=Acidaminococcus massiliensis TaxID=1852375 RepID=UPI00094EB9F0|nr:LysR family transcriptional regulator [Acidaminococcus massiliensis]